MKKKRGKPVRTSDEEDNLEVDYEPSDSDQELDEDDKLILRKTRRQIQGADGSDSESEEEVMGLKSSDESDEDDEDDEDDKEGKGEDSDEEDSEDDESFDEDEDNDVLGDDEGNLPDPKAWGQKRKNYYNTDYVDQDFGGFQNEKEEEAALMEEEEARTIQRRLAEQLDDLDPVLTFATLGDLTKVVDVDDDKREVIETDFSQMNKRDRMVLLEKESPEFLGFIQDFQNYLDCVQNNLLSIIDALKVEQLPSSPASQFVLSMTQLIMNYLTNISFYLLLKARNSNVKNHPVLKQLLQYKELLKEMEPVFQKQIQPQLDSVLEKIKDFDFDGPSENIKSSKKRKLLNLLSSKMVGNKKQDEGSKKTKKDITEDFSDILPQEGSEGSEDTGSESDAEISEKVVENKLNESNPEESKATDKRAITYQIAKNKGLTPRRKKENRNPRVKLKNKFRKAKIRRKGQIREVRRELKRYGGEASGIKASVSKSIKIKY